MNTEENKIVRIGIIGVGGIANGTHITQLLTIPECKITAICDINETNLRNTAKRIGLDAAHCFTDYRDLIACPEVDAVEVCTPNYLHVGMAAAAMRAGKNVNVEKPLSVDCHDIGAIEEELARGQVRTMMCFSYRFFPAVRFAKWILEQHLVGDIVNVDIAYLKDSAFWEGRRLDWRFVREYAGTGALGDLGVHLLDLASFLVGDFTSVCAAKKTVVKQRKRLDSEEIADVTTDDYCSVLAKIGDEIDASILISRAAVGNKNTIKFDIYGTKGIISINLNNPNTLSLCAGEIDLKTKNVRTVEVPPEFRQGQEQTFVDLNLGRECKYLPTLRDGVKLQRVLDAIDASSKERRWVDIP